MKQHTAELIAEAKRCLVEEDRVREFSTGTPTVVELVSSKRLSKIEPQFDVEVMGEGASDAG